MTIPDIIATIGVSLLLVAFLMQILKVIKSEGFVYGFLNLIGAALAGYSSWLMNFIPFVILEGVWAFVALLGLLKVLKR